VFLGNAAYFRSEKYAVKIYQNDIIHQQNLNYFSGGTSMSGKNEKLGPAVIIAVIGAIATVTTACITGFFGLLPVIIDQINPAKSPDPEVMSISDGSIKMSADDSVAKLTPTQTETLVGTVTPTVLPTSTPTPLPRLLFASSITTNGLALNPNTEFKSGINELYAVFPTGMTPPGTVVSEETPEEGGYYAFLKIEENSSLSRIGWRWIYDGAIVNEHEIDVVAGDDIWLAFYNYQEGGIFGAAPLPYGKYTIIITLGGNPSMSADLIIEP
jgi:hypothetical protein